MTDKNTPAPASDQEAETTSKPSSTSAKPAASKVKPAPKRPQTSQQAQQKNSISKTAVLALILSAASLAGLGGGYVWLTEQQQALINDINQHNQQQLLATEQELQQVIKLQQQSTLQQAAQQSVQLTEQGVNSLLTPMQDELARVSKLANNIQQSKATPWLVKEAEYLIRVAARSLWLEKDAQVAIRLLGEADSKLKALNNPEYLPIRQQISQDIAGLTMLPPLATDEVILSLIGLSGQADELPIAMAHLPTPMASEPDLELSDNTDDWRENLAKTWQRFIADFITVKRRTANVEALLSPKQQQSLRQNLQLKLQLAQWAASQHKKQVYQQALSQVTTWLDQYFDTDHTAVINFKQAIAQLNSQVITLNLPESLDSLNAIRQHIEQKEALILPAAPVSEETKPVEPTQAEPEQKEPIADDESGVA